MQASLRLTKDDCLTLLNQYYTNEYQVPVEVTPLFPLLANGSQPTVFFRMNESMLDEHGFYTVLKQILEESGFMIMETDTHVQMDEKLEFQGVTVIIQLIAEANLNVLPEWLGNRIKNLQFVDRIRRVQMR